MPLRRDQAYKQINVARSWSKPKICPKCNECNTQDAILQQCKKIMSLASYQEALAEQKN